MKFTSEGGLQWVNDDGSPWIRRPSGKAEGEFNAIFARPDLTGRTKLETALAFDASGRPGAEKIRARQELITKRLAALTAKPAARSAWVPRAQRFGDDRSGFRGSFVLPPDRDERRAHASGDAALAIALAESWHAHMGGLYTSSRASVVYGRGGQEDSADVYAKSYRAYGPRGSFHPVARWKNAGARVAYATHQRHRGAGEIVIETARGKEVARLPLPSQPSIHTDHPSLIHGDLYAVERTIAGRRITRRYGVREVCGAGAGWRWVCTGLALWVPVADGGYWEHGKSMREIVAEMRHKAEAAQRLEAERREAGRIGRAARLIARLCPGLVVRYDDARKAGYCAPGIDGFLARFGLEDRTEATAAELRALGHADVERPIAQAARRVATERLCATK